MCISLLWKTVSHIFGNLNKTVIPTPKGKSCFPTCFLIGRGFNSILLVSLVMCEWCPPQNPITFPTCPLMTVIPLFTFPTTQEIQSSFKFTRIQASLRRLIANTIFPPSASVNMHPKEPPCLPYINKNDVALAEWLSWLVHCPMHQKVVGSILGQVSYLTTDVVGSIPSQGANGRLQIDVSHIYVSLCLSLPSFFSKINKHILRYELKKERMI